ncbi:Holliday junction branch migration DNA helicase RuvB [Sulfurihydrogenibium azorense]|uniref:Holliday junction branch migration DNA helicase RuvB n=1 Tax=Sulfurihydrogenibium azorense TaxID=309806 RepID=UPI00240A3A8E|nr:Holliday junction branch migration DNA helicase RuvB [Sulfurihydrogenibium azorense]MDM7273208.1 Holliday junction branch migration DNA helicase RuvB [Sulfurihydrogenibium azorense]
MEKIELSVRPKFLDDFIGQDEVKRQLKVFIEAAKLKNKPLDHVILSGPPGLGKTTLASVIANEMGSNIKITSAPVLEKKGDLIGLLTSLKDNDILFIDEIHRLSPSLEEILYSAMEDFKVDVILGGGSGRKERSAKAIRLDLAKFTLIGATTRVGMLSSPLMSRFGIVLNLDFYDEDSLSKIILRTATINNIPITQEGALEIAKHSKGTPRIANKLLSRVYDYAVIHGNKVIDKEVANQALRFLSIQELGIDSLSLKYLKTLVIQFNGGPVGLNTISFAISEDKRTIEEVIEPYLLKIGFIKRTAKGRVALKPAFEFLNLDDNT